MQEGVFHLSVKMIQRSKGRSATGAIAYRAGIDITDERTGQRFNYTRKTGVSYSEIVLPEGAPEEYRDRKTLWNAVEKSETRTNSAVAREFELALPFDLPRRVREQLASDIAHHIVEEFHVAADANCHDPHPRRTNDDGKSSKNYHVHILTSGRKLTATGFTEKVRELDSAKTGSALIEEVRERWAQMVNEAYSKYGVEKFVDHRSFERRNIDLEPQIHVGVNQDGERAQQNAAIIAARHLARLERESATIQQAISLLLVKQTPVGETVPLFALEPATEEPRFPLETAPEPTPRPDPRQLELDFTEPAPAVVTHHEKSEPTPASLPPANITSLDKIKRLNELEQLKKKAGVYGRGIEELREQRSNAASFQRDLDKLDRPSLFHRFIQSKRWQAYEKEHDEIQVRIDTATRLAQRLQAVVKEHKQYVDLWDKGGGHAEHKALTKELGYDQPQKGTASPDTGTPASRFTSSISLNTGFGS